jgi:hypothetical protein
MATADPVAEIVAALLDKIADDLEADAKRIRERAGQLRTEGLPDPYTGNRRHSLKVVPEEWPQL